MGRFDHGGNLHINSLEIIPDDTPETTLDDLADKQDNEDGLAWACSYLVDSHRDACQRPTKSM